MLSDEERQRYITMRDAGRFKEALAIVRNQVYTDKPTPRLKHDAKAEAISVIMEIGQRMKEYACNEVNAAQIRGYEVDQLDFNERMKSRPSLNQTIRTHPELREDRYWLLEDIGKLVGMQINTMSNKKVLGCALRAEGFDKKRMKGTYYWYRKQRVM